MNVENYDLVIESRIHLPAQSLALARKTLLNSTVFTDYAILVRTGDEVVGGVAMIYFDFSYGDHSETRVYAG